MPSHTYVFINKTIDEFQIKSKYMFLFETLMSRIQETMKTLQYYYVA